MQNISSFASLIKQRCLFGVGLMKKKHRILFVVPTIFGHLGPSLPVVEHLLEDGHTVGYSSGSPAKPALSKIGIHEFFPRDAYHSTLLDKRILVKGIYELFYNIPKIYNIEFLKQYYRELIDAIESFKPDVIYLDTYDYLAEPLIAKTGIPYAHASAMVPFYFEWDIPPFGTGWDIGTPLINRLKLPFFVSLVGPFILKRQCNQKKALKSISRRWNKISFRDISPYLYMLFSTDKFEYPRKEFVPQMYCVGPSIIKKNEDQSPDFPWEKIDGSRPLIYIATGTLFINEYKDFYKNTLNALSDKHFPFPIQVVMAMGKQEYIDELGEIPPNFIVVPYAPQLELLKKSSLFITHGGANSVNEALLFGKPMLVVHWGGDRLDVGKRVDYRKAGICIDVKDATSERIRNHVIRLINEPVYTQSSEVIMDSYKKCDGGRTAADLVTHLANTRKPIYRRKGTPITIASIDDLPNYTG